MRTPSGNLEYQKLIAFPKMTAMFPEPRLNANDHIKVEKLQAYYTRLFRTAAPIMLASLRMRLDPRKKLGQE